MIPYYEQPVSVTFYNATRLGNRVEHRSLTGLKTGVIIESFKETLCKYLKQQCNAMMVTLRTHFHLVNNNYNSYENNMDEKS